MPESRRTRPRDPNQLGKLVADIATGQVDDRILTDDGRDVADEIVRRNPRAAENLDGIKRAISTLDKLRKAGVARGPRPLMPPHSGRYSEIQKPTRKVTPAFKTTFRA